MTDPEALRRSAVADVIRRERLVAVLRRVAPQERLVALVEELVDAGVRVVEVTFDAPTAAADLRACRAAVGAGSCDVLVGAGTLRSVDAIAAALDAGADFGVSPLFDPFVLEAALARRLPFVPGALTPTEIDAAWRAGATFVKLFPASSVGPTHVRELRGPMAEIELIPTGGIDGSSARAYLAAGAVAVGIGGAIVNADSDARRALVAAVRGAA
jgi:2-dehydro-3-deoxyphosphogluconate aldolase/(4S)-4-hydroxy-2-oxoglutarate aldolase